MSFTPSQRPSPSPSTSTSSQGSIVLGHPPLGWQKKLMLSLKEDTIAKPENRFDSLASFSGEMSPSCPTNVADSKLKNGEYLTKFISMFVCGCVA